MSRFGRCLMWTVASALCAAPAARAAEVAVSSAKPDFVLQSRMVRPEPFRESRLQPGA